MTTFTEKSRTDAIDALFGDPNGAQPKEQDYISTERVFNTRHDLTEFFEVAQQKYTQVEQPTADVGYVPSHSLVEETAPAIESTETGQMAFTEIPVQKTEDMFEPYHNPANPAPSYRPATVMQLDQSGHIERVESNTITVPQPVQIFEIALEEQQKSIEKAKREKVVETDVEVATGNLRLNARGMIAIASFFAIVILATVLIIVNAVSINSSSARISALNAEVTAAEQRIGQLTDQRTQAFAQATRDLYNADGTVNEGALRDMGYVQLERPIQLPPQQMNPTPDNPDRSTNWFDGMSRWFSGWFN